jgi:hypothetical protein
MLQYSKWGSCSCLVPLVLKELGDANDDQRKNIEQLVEDLLREGMDAVTMTPSDALRPLFDCIITTARQWFLFSGGKQDSAQRQQCSYVRTMKRCVGSLLGLMEESTISIQSAYFLNETSALIFQPKFLQEEYERLQVDSSCDTPIRDTFRRLMDFAGTKRPHVSRAVLCRITVGWAGVDDDDTAPSKGLNAIPYRDVSFKWWCSVS